MLKKLLKKKTKIIGITFFVVLIIFIVMYLIIIINRKTDRLVSENGTLDLSDWRNSNYKVADIEGEWEFYWKQLLLEDDFKGSIVPNAIVNIPSVWNNYQVNGEKLSGFGYATFRIHLTNVEAGKPLAMRVSPSATAYMMYIDDMLVAQNGTVGTSKETSKAEYGIRVFEFTPASNSVDVIIQISNYTNSKGGLWYSPQIGIPEDIYKVNQMISDRDIFLLGCFVVMFFYSITIFLLDYKEKSYLFFAGLCITTIIRTIIYGSYVISRLPIISELDFLIRLDYLSWQWLGLLFLLLSSSQYSNFINTKIIKTYIIYSISLSLFIVCTPISIFSSFNMIMSVICIAMGIYTIIKVMILAINGAKDTWITIIPGLLVFLCVIHDFLVHKNVILGYAVESLPIGFWVFLFFQNVLIAKKYSESKKDSERTLLLIESISKKERESELKFLKSQIKPHFIYNALNAIIAISRRDSEEARKLLFDFSQYLRSCFDFENFENLVTLDKELRVIRSYISIENARFQDAFKVMYEIENINVMIPTLILEPLVENAIRHGLRSKLEGGKIIIYIKNMEDKICMGVKDNGLGIELSRVKGLLEGKEKNHGFGIYNINQRLTKLYNTSLIIENNLDGGANIYMIIPLHRGGNAIEDSNNR